MTHIRHKEIELKKIYRYEQSMFKYILIPILIILNSCGTIVNDANVPVSLSFSDGSSGKCKLSNKRAQYLVDVP